MFCNYGEPLLNPNTPRFIALARSYLMRTALSPLNMTYEALRRQWLTWNRASIL